MIKINRCSGKIKGIKGIKSKFKRVMCVIACCAMVVPTLTACDADSIHDITENEYNSRIDTNKTYVDQLQKCGAISEDTANLLKDYFKSYAEFKEAFTKNGKISADRVSKMTTKVYPAVTGINPVAEDKVIPWGSGDVDKVNNNAKGGSSNGDVFSIQNVLVYRAKNNTLNKTDGIDTLCKMVDGIQECINNGVPQNAETIISQYFENTNQKLFKEDIPLLKPTEANTGDTNEFGKDFIVFMKDTSGNNGDSSGSYVPGLAIRMYEINKKYVDLVANASSYNNNDGKYLLVNNKALLMSYPLSIVSGLQQSGKVFKPKFSKANLLFNVATGNVCKYDSSQEYIDKTTPIVNNSNNVYIGTEDQINILLGRAADSDTLKTIQERLGVLTNNSTGNGDTKKSTSDDEDNESGNESGDTSNNTGKIDASKTLILIDSYGTVGSFIKYFNLENAQANSAYEKDSNGNNTLKAKIDKNTSLFKGYAGGVPKQFIGQIGGISGVESVFIDLGVNAPNDIESIKSLIDDVGSQYPKARVLVCAIPNPTNSNTDLINKYNEAVKDYISGKENYKFISTFDVISGSDGKIKSEYLSSDKIHLNSEGENKWFEELNKYMAKRGESTVGSNVQYSTKHTAKSLWYFNQDNAVYAASPVPSAKATMETNVGNNGSVTTGASPAVSETPSTQKTNTDGQQITSSQSSSEQEKSTLITVYEKGTNGVGYKLSTSKLYDNNSNESNSSFVIIPDTEETYKYREETKDPNGGADKVQCEFEVPCSTIVMRDYLEFVPTPGYSGGNYSPLGRRIRFTSNSLINGVNDTDTLAEYIDNSGSNMFPLAADSSLTTVPIRLSDIVDSESNNSAVKAAKFDADGTEVVDATSNEQKLSKKVGDPGAEITYTNDINTVIEFPYSTGDDKTNLENSLPLLYGVKVKKDIYDTSLNSMWLKSNSDTNSSEWWNQWLKANGYTYTLNLSELNGNSDAELSYEQQQKENIMLDYDTIGRIQKDIDVRNTESVAGTIRTIFVALGIILLFYGLMIPCCWLFDTNVLLGPKLLTVITFGKWIAVPTKDDILEQVEDDRTRYIDLKGAIIGGILVLAVGSLFVSFDIITLIIAIVKTIANGGIWLWNLIFR